MALIILAGFPNSANCLDSAANRLISRITRLDQRFSDRYCQSTWKYLLKRPNALVFALRQECRPILKITTATLNQGSQRFPGFGLNETIFVSEKLNQLV